MTGDTGKPQASALENIETKSAEETRLLGQALAEFLDAGDLVILEGELGAGKTTFTQGLGAGLGVKQRVTSPTFIIARTHRAEIGSGKPQLVHVDAYRLEGGDDVDALDLESALENSIVVVEWGRGKVEDLSAHTLLIELKRPQTEEIPVTGTIADIPGDTNCMATFRSVSGNWNLSGVKEAWQSLVAAANAAVQTDDTEE